MKTPFEYDIFISYSQKDRAAAERLHAALEARKLKVWRDKRLTEAPAKDFIAQIDRAHERSARVLVLWSRASAVSAWVLAEAEKARVAGKILPLALEPIGALLPCIPSPFNILPTLDASAAILDLEPVLRAMGAEQAEGQPPGAVSLVTANVDISRLPDTYAEKLYGRDSEMAELLKAWDDGQTRIFAFDAMGGAGKTALVYHFVQALKASGWHGARSVFAWSFYSQGSDEDRQTSADDFFKAAFAHFSGGEKAPPRDPHQKGVDLAHLVQAHRALLILDGLEPLQYAAHGGPQSPAASRRHQGPRREGASEGARGRQSGPLRRHHADRACRIGWSRRRHLQGAGRDSADGRHCAVARFGRRACDAASGIQIARRARVRLAHATIRASPRIRPVRCKNFAGHARAGGQGSDRGCAGAERPCAGAHSRRPIPRPAQEGRHPRDPRASRSAAARRRK